MEPPLTKKKKKKSFLLIRDSTFHRVVNSEANNSKISVPKSQKRFHCKEIIRANVTSPNAFFIKFPLSVIK
jgi:hypothetical protein